MLFFRDVVLDAVAGVGTAAVVEPKVLRPTSLDWPSDSDDNQSAVPVSEEWVPAKSAADDVANWVVSSTEWVAPGGDSNQERVGEPSEVAKVRRRQAELDVSSYDWSVVGRSRSYDDRSMDSGVTSASGFESGEWCLCSCPDFVRIVF